MVCWVRWDAAYPNELVECHREDIAVIKLAELWPLVNP